MASRTFSLCAFARSSADSGEQSLPDHFLFGKNLPSGNIIRTSEELQFPYEFPYPWNSPSECPFSSPVESCAGSNGTESEEDDDYIAGLAERVAYLMLDDDDDVAYENFELGNASWTAEEKKRSWAADNLKVSPKSSLAGQNVWSASKWGSASSSSSKSSSRVSSQVSSPPLTPVGVGDDAWDLVYAAAGEVVKLKMLDEAIACTACPPVMGGLEQGLASGFSQSPHASWGQSYTSSIHRMPLPSSRQPKRLPARNSSFSASSCSSKDKAAHLQAQNYQRSLSAKTKEEERRLFGCQHRDRHIKPGLKQQSNAVCRSAQKTGSGRAHWSSVSSQWPSVQPAGGSGMRAVFLGSNGSGRESGGTGVFLPRRVGTGSESKKKPSCSTVLLPTRIVQALNLNVEDVRSHPLRSVTQLHRSVSRKDSSHVSPSFPPTPPMLPRVSYEAATMESFTDYGRRSMHPVHSLQQVVSEISLPTEWTY